MRKIALFLLLLVPFSVVYSQSIIGTRPGVTAISNLVISTESADLDVGEVGSAYSDSFAVSGGVSPYICSLASGSDPLPNGIVINSNCTITGTPTIDGTFPFTVQAVDSQDAEPHPAGDTETKLLVLTVNPAALGGGQVAYEDAEDGNLTADPAWTSAGGCSVSANGFIEDDEEIAKTTSTDCVFVDNIDDAELWVAFDLYRDGSAFPDTNEDEVFKAVDSGGTVLFRLRVENDWDVFAFTPGQTTFNNRGFFLGNLPADTIWYIEMHYLKGSGSDAVFEVKVDDANQQSFTEGTATANVDRLILSDENTDAAQDFYFDRFEARTDTWADRGPIPFTPPTPDLNFFEDFEDNNLTSNPTWTAAGGCDVQTNGFLEGNDEGRKNTSTDCVMVDNVDLATISGGFDLYRNGAALPDSDRDAVLVGLDADDNVLFSMRIETDWDVFFKTPGQTANGGRGFFLGTPATDNDLYIEFIYTKGTGADAQLSVRVDGGTAQSFSTGTATTNVDRVIWRDVNDDASQRWFFDRIDLLSSGVFPGRGPLDGTPVTGTQVTSYGAACNGTTDDGPALAAAFADEANWINNTLIFPAGQVCVSAQKLTISNSSGWTIAGQGATIKAANGLANNGTGLLDVQSVSNFVINNLDMDGNRANRVGAELGGCDNYRFRNAQNGTIRDVDSNNACNDNARIAATSVGDTNTFSKNLTFVNWKSNNARRNNVSVIEGWNIQWLGTCTPGPGGNMFLGTCTCQFTGANGTNPKAGIDLEPNRTSAVPGTDGHLVDGCLMADNDGAGHTDIGAYTTGEAFSLNTPVNRNVTVRNSILRNNASGAGRNAASIQGSGEVWENNWIGQQDGARFAVIYVTGRPGPSTGSTTAGGAGRDSEIKNNFIDGIPPLSSDTNARRVLHCGNAFPTTPSRMLFHDNVMTNIGVSASGDWCNPNVNTCGTNDTVYDNTVDSVEQTPNPGCP